MSKIYEQLSLTELIACMQKQIEDKTGLRCYDNVPKNAGSPFYFAEFISKRPNNTKTMFREIYSVYVHAVANPSESSVEIYDLIQKLEEAMTEEICLSEKFDLISQVSNGILTVKTDETNEKHAVISYEFDVCYGYRVK